MKEKAQQAAASEHFPLVFVVILAIAGTLVTIIAASYGWLVVFGMALVITQVAALASGALALKTFEARTRPERYLEELEVMAQNWISIKDYIEYYDSRRGAMSFGGKVIFLIEEGNDPELLKEYVDSKILSGELHGEE